MAGNVYDLNNPIDRNTNTESGRAAKRAEWYDGNPEAQMRNSLKAAGYNPNRRNPFMSQLLQAAKGLALSSEMSNAGLSADSIAAKGGAPLITQDFMTDALKSGSVFSALANSAGGAQGLMGKLTDYENTRESLGPGQQNVFMELLADKFANPSGAAQAFQSLYSPLLGGQAGKAYGEQIQDSMMGAFDSFANDDRSFGPGQLDFWDYIFGNRTPQQQQMDRSARPGVGPQLPPNERT